MPAVHWNLERLAETSVSCVDVVLNSPGLLKSSYDARATLSTDSRNATAIILGYELLNVVRSVLVASMRLRPRSGKHQKSHVIVHARTVLYSTRALQNIEEYHSHPDTGQIVSSALDMYVNGRQ